MEEPSKKKKKLSAKETKKSIDAIGKKIEVRLKTLSHFMFLSIILARATTVVQFSQKLGKKHLKLLPSKILEIDEICKSPQFLTINAGDYKLTSKLREALKEAAGPYVKRRKLEGLNNIEELPKVVPPYDGGPKILSNELILSMMKIVKLKHAEAMEGLSAIKMWIQLNLPRFEDGNNFRVGVQEECISELSRVEDTCFSVMDSMSKYFSTRARLVSKCLKHPDVEDYKRSIEEVDHMQAVNLRMSTLDLRNNYTILHDVLKKNDDRLEKDEDDSAMAMMY